MIVEPYKLRPVAPQVALLTPDGVPVSEHGELLDLDDWPPGCRLWASYETVYALVRAGNGEALCWDGEEIRWRHRRFEDGWKRRASDANVIKLPLDHLRFEQSLAGFAAWRDWLAAFGASPTGTSGSAAWSLLRARLERRLVTGAGERPPLLQTLGGRQQLGPAGQGRFEGRLELHDLPSAYAATLAGLRYGGTWLEAADTPGRRLETFAGGDYPVFVRARVRVPELDYGPLPRRPRRRVARGFLAAALAGSTYPVGRTLQGLWTWEELAAAEAAGCRVERVLGGWVHRSGWFPFAPWWEAVEQGRRMPGLAGQLAKLTGNALWGRFAMDPRSSGGRTIRSHNGRRLRARLLPERPFPFPAHDLAETVSGRVRARLFLAMLAAGEGLVSAHTDGLWIESTSRPGQTASREPHKLEDRVQLPGPLSEEWRVKSRARRLDVLDPQVLRVWPRDPAAEPRVVYAGRPVTVAAEDFERAWARAGFAA